MKKKRIFAMKESCRKCAKCGRSPAQNPGIVLHRFPCPGFKNALRCEQWAKYLLPNGEWHSRQLHKELYTQHRMLCNLHFNRSSFFDYEGKKLVRSAAPDPSCDEVPETDKTEDELQNEDQQFKKPVTPPLTKSSLLKPLKQAGDKLQGFPLMVAGKPEPEQLTSTVPKHRDHTYITTKDPITVTRVFIRGSYSLSTSLQTDNQETISTDETPVHTEVLPGSYTIVIQQETDQDSPVDKATETTQKETVQNQNVAVQKKKVTVQKQNDTVQKQNITAQKRNVTVQKQKATVQKQNVAAQKRSDAVQKGAAIGQKASNTVQKTMMLAELPVGENEHLMEKEYIMVVEEGDGDDRDDDDDHRPWRVDDDEEEDAVTYEQDSGLHAVIENDIVIETQSEESSSIPEVLDSSHVTQSSETTELLVEQYGQCRCCLEMGTHTVVDVIHELGCFNILLETDPRLSRLVCSACGKFLQEARRFRDMAVASQKQLLDNLTNSDVKYPAVWSNPSGVPAAHEDECEQELVDEQQSGLRKLEMTDDGGIQDEMSDDEDMKVELGVPDDEDTKLDLGVPDDGETQERPVFSRLSDYPDAQMGTEVNYENLTTQGFQEMVQANKTKRAKFFVHIRQNLIKILDYSTVLPFLSVTGERFECIYCDGTFHHIDQLRAHVEDSHRNEETEFKHDILKLLPEMILFVDISSINCRLCDEQLTTIDNLVQHLVETHKKRYHKICLDPPHNIVPFNLSLDVPQCVECGKIFPDYKKLRQHVTKHYGQYLCHQCGSKFLYHKLYHQHILTHQDYNKNKQTCDECGVSFKNKKLLLFHYYKNHYDKMKKQIAQSDVKESTVDVKEENRDIAYECTLCDNGTTYTLTAAYMHRIGHLNNTREGPYSCEVCGHTSPLKKEFRAHLQVHYGIKKFVCEVCKKTFKKNSQLSDHMSVHLNLRFHCPLCDTTVYDKKLLMRHVKNQHPDVNVAFSL